MKTRFAFVDEDGQDRVLTGEEVLDTQFQLGYRYDDDPQRSQRLDLNVLVAKAPGAAPGRQGATRVAPTEPIVLARGSAMTLAARESHVTLAAVSRPPTPPSGRAAGGPPRLRVVLRDVVAGDRTPPYDVFLVRDGGSPGTSAVRIGGLDLFGGAGHGQHAHHRGETITFEASDAAAQLSRGRDLDLRNLKVSIVRRGFANAAGGEFVPNDPHPPRIGAIELIQS
jgi:hypothetical protein